MQLGGVPLIQIKRIYHAASRHGRETIEQRGRLPFLADSVEKGSCCDAEISVIQSV